MCRGKRKAGRGKRVRSESSVMAKLGGVQLQAFHYVSLFPLPSSRFPLPALLADLLVLFHATFVLFVVAGGLLVLKWPRLAWLHIPCALWGVLIEFGGWICPLTPLENTLRQRAGEAGYSGGFVEHYVLHVLYPS